MIIYYHCTSDNLVTIIFTNLPSLLPLSFYEMIFILVYIVLHSFPCTNTDFRQFKSHANSDDNNGRVSLDWDDVDGSHRHAMRSAYYIRVRLLLLSREVIIAVPGCFSACACAGMSAFQLCVVWE